MIIILLKGILKRYGRIVQPCSMQRLVGSEDFIINMIYNKLILSILLILIFITPSNAGLYRTIVNPYTGQLQYVNDLSFYVNTSFFSQCNPVLYFSYWNGSYLNCWALPAESDPAAILNISINFVQWSNQTDPAAVHTETDPIAMANITTNFANWSNTSNTTYAGYADLISTLQNNDTKYQNHYNLSNLDYASSGHTGFESTISSGTPSQFWNGLKQWITLAASNISNFNQTVNSTVDRNLANYTNTYSWLNNSLVYYKNEIYNTTEINTSLSSKANKTGESFNNITNINQSNTLNLISDYYLPFDIVVKNNANIPRWYSYNNGSTLGSYMIGVRGRGNYTNPLPIIQGDNLLLVTGAGYYTNSSTSSSNPAIILRASENWSSINQGTEIIFTGRKNGSVGSNWFQMNEGNLYSYAMSASAQTSAMCYNISTGIITYNSGATTCLSSSSNTKLNITNITKNITLDFMKVQPVTYTQNNENNAGLIAEDLEKLFPDLVTNEYIYDEKIIYLNEIDPLTGKNKTDIVKTNIRKGNTTGIKYENMIAILSKVIQEQQVIINKICKKNQTLCI